MQKWQPSQLSRFNELKTAIKSAFPILFAVMTLKEAEVNNIEALEDKFAHLITEWNQENELGKQQLLSLLSLLKHFLRKLAHSKGCF